VHSYILATNSKQKALKKISEILERHSKVQPWRTPKLDLTEIKKTPDILLIEPENSIKIKQIRNFKKTLSRKPVSLPFQAAILLNAELTTLPAQHALLKILEEPGKNTFLFLITPNPPSLLPTIRSRCQTIHFKIDKPKIGPEKEKQILSLIKSLQKSTPGQQLKLIEPYEKSREVATNFCREIIYILEEKLASPEFAKLAQSSPISILRSTHQTLLDLQANINTKLALDNWALKL